MATESPNTDVEGCISRREALFEILCDLLSNNSSVRSPAEECLHALEVTEDFGVLLAEFTVDSCIDMSVRQLASVILKQYVDTHWSSRSKLFHPPEASERVKKQIRNILVLGFGEPSSKIRSAIAYAISAIASRDWPEEWPEFFNMLVSLLTCTGQSLVLCAMQVLKEFTRNLSYNQLPNVAQVLLDQILRIYVEDQKYTFRIRRKAVELFTSCAMLVADSSSSYRKRYLYPVLPTYCTKFIQTISKTDTTANVTALKSEVMKALTTLIRKVPKQMDPWLADILTPVWRILIQNADIYRTTVINVRQRHFSGDSSVDSDGCIRDVRGLLLEICEFLSAVVEVPKFRPSVECVLEDLVYYLILCMEITAEEESSWDTDPSRYAEDIGREPSFTASVRLGAQALLANLCKEFETQCYVSLAEACTKHIREAATSRSEQNSYWWKIHEACMFAIGSARDLVLRSLRSGLDNYDLTGFFENVVMADMKETGPPLLLGQCIIVGSCYAQFMCSQVLHQFLGAISSGLRPNQNHIISISSIRAVGVFSENLKGTDNVHMLLSALPSFLDSMNSMFVESPSEVLSVALETVNMIVSVDDGFAASCSAKVIAFSVNCFMNHNTEPGISVLCQRLFKALSQNAECAGPLHEKLVPALMDTFAAPSNNIWTDNSVSFVLHAVVFDILETLVRNSTPPLKQALVDTAFPAVVHSIGRSNDSAVIMAGVRCLRTYIFVSPQQVWDFRDSDGCTGLRYILEVVNLLLGTTVPKFDSTYVGRLLINFISKAGSLLRGDLDTLLKTVLSKLNRCDCLDVVQSSCVVFAHLVNTQFNAALDFLSTIPGPHGGSALDFVMNVWTCNQCDFFGYERIISVMALCKLLHHGVLLKDNRLRPIVVKDDHNFETRRRMVSRTRCQVLGGEYDLWTNVPLVVKILKILINELVKCLGLVIEEELSVTEADDGAATDSDSGEDEAFLQRKDTEDTAQEKEPEPECLIDPLYKIDLNQYIPDFVRSFCAVACLPEFVQHLTAQEKRILQASGITFQI
ncbi:importin-9 [Anabrus simplex]|uniref:importin-9 n=1 Tax=Anabrus simplex TaxID=316456 RepID=UPI0035A3CC6C